MKNEKIVEVCKVVIQVCNIAVVVAQAIASAFPVKNLPEGYTQEDLKLIKDFLKETKND